MPIQIALNIGKIVKDLLMPLERKIGAADERTDRTVVGPRVGPSHGPMACDMRYHGK